MCAREVVGVAGLFSYALQKVIMTQRDHVDTGSPTQTPFLIEYATGTIVLPFGTDAIISGFSDSFVSSLQVIRSPVSASRSHKSLMALVFSIVASGTLIVIFALVRPLVVDVMTGMLPFASPVCW